MNYLSLCLDQIPLFALFIFNFWENGFMTVGNCRILRSVFYILDFPCLRLKYNSQSICKTSYRSLYPEVGLSFFKK